MSLVNQPEGLPSSTSRQISAASTDSRAGGGAGVEAMGSSLLASASEERLGMAMAFRGEGGGSVKKSRVERANYRAVQRARGGKDDSDPPPT